MKSLLKKKNKPMSDFAGNSLFWITLASSYHKKITEQIIGEHPFFWFDLFLPGQKDVGFESLELAFNWYVQETIRFKKEAVFGYSDKQGRTLLHVLGNCRRFEHKDAVPSKVFYLMREYQLSPYKVAGHTDFLNGLRAGKERSRVETYWHMLFLLPMIWRSCHSQELYNLNLSMNCSITRRVMAFLGC
jgi:hypothetical protein